MAPWVVLACLAGTAGARAADGPAVEGTATAVPAAGRAAVQDVNQLPPLVEWRPGDPVSVRPPRVVHGARAPVGPEQVEPLPPAERWPPLPANFTKKFVVDGTPFTGPSPPDTTGAVGP